VIGGGLDDDLLQPFFMVGMKGVAEDDGAMAAVQQVVLDVLAHHAAQGFAPSLIASTMNTFEFSLRENNTGAMPRGLASMLRSSGAWVHAGGDGLFATLKYEERLASLKARLESGEPVFERLLQEHLLSNGHRVTVELVPDPSVGPARVAAETALLREAGQQLGAAGVERVIAEAAALQQIQHQPDPPEVLAMVPHLSISDMPPAGKETPTAHVDAAALGLGAGVEWLQHDLPTSGIVYVNLAFDLGAVAKEDVPLLSLFASCLKQNGLTTGEDFVAVAERIGATTGGVGASVVNSVVHGQAEPQAHLMMRGKAMASQAAELSTAMGELLLHANLDNQPRVATLVGEMVADTESSVLGAGHAMCLTRLNASEDLSGWMDEQLGGVSALHHLRQLQKDVEQDWPAVLRRLQRIQIAVVHSGGLTVDVTADAASLRTTAPALVALVNALPPAPADGGDRFAWGPLEAAGDEAFVVPTQVSWHKETMRPAVSLCQPTQVNYVAKGGKCALAPELYGAGLVLSKLLGTTYLWDQVRVVGGAYGVFGVYDWRRGVFNYVSYRDPKLADTLATYDGTAAFVGGMELDEGSLTKAVVSTIGELDAPMLPDAQGMTAMLQHLRGEEATGRQARREQVLGTTAEGFARIAEALAAVAEGGTVKVVGSAEAVAAYGKFASTERLL
jgi:Zn-dependent M16 (insulinase) family peptidase